MLCIRESPSCPWNLTPVLQKFLCKKWTNLFTCWTTHASVFVICQQSKWKWLELITIPVIELVHELNPVQTQCMQEGTQCFHHEQYESSSKSKNYKPCQLHDKTVIPMNNRVAILVCDHEILAHQASTKEKYRKVSYKSSRQYIENWMRSLSE